MILYLNVFNHRNALTEVCVLADVLAIVKEKRYMVLDAVPQEAVEVKPMVQVYARKKALTGASQVLLSGAERLKNCQNELARNRATPDFHIELLRLRQNWRLKKVSNSIIGDLSYRTGIFSIEKKISCLVFFRLLRYVKNVLGIFSFSAGSKYTQTGMFEVTKAEEEEKTWTSPPASPNPNSTAQPSLTPSQSHSSSNSKVNPSALRVTIPSELQGVAYIEVLCQKGKNPRFSEKKNPKRIKKTF